MLPRRGDRALALAAGRPHGPDAFRGDNHTGGQHGNAGAARFHVRGERFSTPDMVPDAVPAGDPRHLGRITAIAATKDAVHFVTAWKEISLVPRGAFGTAAGADPFIGAAREAGSRQRQAAGPRKET